MFQAHLNRLNCKNPLAWRNIFRHSCQIKAMVKDTPRGYIRSGNRIDRIGYSLPFFQDLFQNGTHTTFIGNQNYYLNYRNFQRGLYVYSGYYNPFTLYGH